MTSVQSQEVSVSSEERIHEIAVEAVRKALAADQVVTPRTQMHNDRNFWLRAFRRGV